MRSSRSAPGKWDLSAPLAPNARLRYDVIARLLDPLSEIRSFMEVGCGAGALALILSRRYEYVGYEPDAGSFTTARDRLDRAGRGTVLNRALPNEPYRFFDVVGAFEVLEHLENDAASLASWVRWLRPGGYVVVSVPANPDRFGPWDSYVGHFRRYSREGLRTLLASAGLTDLRIAAYGFPLGYALEYARNRMVGRRLAEAPASATDRTAASGRRLQPDERLAPLVWAASLPFVYVQRPFADGSLGTGFVARGRLPT